MKNRNINIDIIETVAILMVILCHCTQFVYNYWGNISLCNVLSHKSNFFMLLSFTIGRISVPLFLFVSGILLLNKSIENDSDVTNFYKKNLAPLLIANGIWVIIYNIYIYIYNSKELVTFSNIIKQILIMQNVPMAHMWYMPMIIGIYLCIPFVAKIVKVFSQKSIALLLTIVFIVGFIFPTVNFIFSAIKINYSLESAGSLFLLGGVYLVYVLVGYYIYKYQKNIDWRVLSILGIICFAIMIIIQSCLKPFDGSYHVWYDSPFLLLTAIAVFVILLQIDTKKINKKISDKFAFISKATLAIYFIHFILLDLLNPIIASLKIKAPIKVVLLFVLASALSITIVKILSVFKIIKKYVFVIK